LGTRVRSPSPAPSSRRIFSPVCGPCRGPHGAFCRIAYILGYRKTLTISTRLQSISVCKTSLDVRRYSHNDGKVSILVEIHLKHELFTLKLDQLFALAVRPHLLRATSDIRDRARRRGHQRLHVVLADFVETP